MSDIMLLGVLCMPPELWDGSALDVTQRYGRYIQAARRIEEDARELEQLRAKVQAQALQILALTEEVAELAADAGCLRSILDGLRGPLREYVYRTQAHAPFEHAEWVNQMGAALIQATNKVE